MVKADTQINHVGGDATTAAQANHGNADTARVHRAQNPSLRREQRFDDRRGFKVVGVVFDEVRRTALFHHHTREVFRRFTAAQGVFELRVRIRFVFGQATVDEQLFAQRHIHGVQTRIDLLAAQIAHGFGDFECIARAGGEHLVHIGEQGGGLASCVVGDINDGLRQRYRVLVGRHERAVTDFHVHHQAVQAFGEFFRQNGRRNQINRLNGRGDVARGVNAFVAGRQIAGLADDRRTGGFNDVAQLFRVGEGVKARNRREFVQCAAGMPQAAPRNHRHIRAASRDHRREHQRDHVAHAAGGVFVHHRTVQLQVFPFQHAPRVAHGEGEGGALFDVQFVEENRHAHRSDLPFADAVIGHAADVGANVLGVQCAAIAFFLDDFLCEHGVLLILCSK